jgi:hypothetical protein
MQDWKGRAVQNTGRERLRSSRFGSVSVAAEHGKNFEVRGDADRTLHRVLSTGVQMEAIPGQRARQKDRRHKKSSARAARATPQKRKARVAAALSSVQGRIVSQPVVAPRSHTKRSSHRGKARMGGVRVRPRGGASHPCPLCGQSTRVLRTTKVGLSVQRHRECLHCHHEYLTTERRSR